MDLDSALAIIDAAAEWTDKEAGHSDEIVQALSFLGKQGVERETLLWFWSAIHGENYIGRYQNANASRNRIRYLIGRQTR